MTILGRVLDKTQDVHIFIRIVFPEYLCTITALLILNDPLDKYH